MIVACGGDTVNAVSQGAISLSARVTAQGLMVLAVILFMGAISGAHLNPAVSITFAARGDFPWLRVQGYIIAQLVGATPACLLLKALFGNGYSLSWWWIIRILLPLTGQQSRLSFILHLASQESSPCFPI